MIVMGKQTHKNRAEGNFDVRVTSCDWFMNHVQDGLLDPELTFFTDKADFHFVVYINAQKNKHRSSENSHVLFQLPFYNQKKSLWCAIRANHFFELIFYEGTLDTERYINEILNPFFVNLAPAEEGFGYFMQDGMGPHN
jgi:hypothetical protein